MTTNNHPAHGPVSLNRLHQIREILSKAAAQSDGGNLGYSMADAVKVIDGAIAAFGAEPQRNPVLAYADSYRDMAERGVESIPVWSVITDLERNIAPLYTTPPAPVSVPDDVLDALQKVARIRLDLNDFDGDRRGIADCLGDAEEALIEVVNRHAAMLQAGKSPVTPDGYILVPIVPTEDMIINGFESEPDEFFSKSEEWDAYQEMSGCQQAAHRAKLCWAAMIKAAPKQENI